jgi:hypothetical protein
MSEKRKILNNSDKPDFYSKTKANKLIDSKSENSSAPFNLLAGRVIFSKDPAYGFLLIDFAQSRHLDSNVTDGSATTKSKLKD